MESAEGPRSGASDFQGFLIPRLGVAILVLWRPCPMGLENMRFLESISGPQNCYILLLSVGRSMLLCLRRLSCWLGVVGSLGWLCGLALWLDSQVRFSGSVHVLGPLACFSCLSLWLGPLAWSTWFGPPGLVLLRTTWMAPLSTFVSVSRKDP